MKNHTILLPHDSVASLRATIKQTRDQAFTLRVKAIMLRKDGKTPQEIAERLIVSDRSVTGWIRRYNESGIQGIRTKPSGRPEGNPKWDAAPFAQLAKEIDKGGYWSIPRMQEWLAQHENVSIPEQTVWYRMDQLQYSYKSARPHPHQGNPERQTAFKKGVLSRSWSR